MKKRELLERIEALERELADAKARIAWLEARPWPITVPVEPIYPTYPTYPIWSPVTTGDPIPPSHTTIISWDGPTEDNEILF